MRVPGKSWGRGAVLSVHRYKRGEPKCPSLRIVISHLDKLPYTDAKSFLDQTGDAQALPFLIDIAPFMDPDEWLALLDLAWPRIPNVEDYREALRATPYGQRSRKRPRKTT